MNKEDMTSTTQPPSERAIGSRKNNVIIEDEA